MLRMRDYFIFFDSNIKYLSRKNVTMRILTSLFLIIAILSCKQKEDPLKAEISTVEIEEIFNNSTLSIRAIDVASDKSLAFASNNGVFGLYNPQTEEWATATQNYDTLNLQFRAVARTAND